MKLLLRRDQRSAMLGGRPVFQLDVRAEISEDERTAIEKYRLGDTMLYESHTVTGGRGLLGVASRLASKAITLSIAVRDLTAGKRIECKDILEMLAIEDQIRDAGQTFGLVLRACTQFGDEEVVEI